MTFTIPIGWWLAPAVISIASFLRAWWLSRAVPTGGDYGAVGGAMVALFYFGIATITSLIAWLIWAVATILIGGAA